jgi:hypothetical protein
LEEGKLGDFIESTTCLGDFFDAISGSVREECPEPNSSPTLSPSNSDDDINSVRADSPASSLLRADSPAPSSSSSEDSSESGSSSASSNASVASAESTPADPNEPENDGVDMSDKPRFSGSFNTMYIDEETGLQHDDDDDDDEEEEEEAGEEKMKTGRTRTRKSRITQMMMRIVKRTSCSKNHLFLYTLSLTNYLPTLVQY